MERTEKGVTNQLPLSFSFMRARWCLRKRVSMEVRGDGLACLDGADYSSSPDQSKSPLGTACPRNWCQGYPFQLPAERNRERKDFESGSRGRQKPLLSQHLTQNPIQQTGRLSPGKGDPGGIIFYGLGQDSPLITGTKFSVESVQNFSLCFFFFFFFSFL